MFQSRTGERFRLSALVQALVLVVSADAIAIAAFADGFDGKWTGRYKVDAGRPFFCTPEGDFTAVVTGTSLVADITSRFGRHAVPGSVRADGSWEGLLRLPTGTMVEFHGKFEGGRLTGSYGAGTDCPGTILGGKG